MNRLDVIICTLAKSAGCAANVRSSSTIIAANAITSVSSNTAAMWWQKLSRANVKCPSVHAVRKRRESSCQALAYRRIADNAIAKYHAKITSSVDAED